MHVKSELPAHAFAYAFAIHLLFGSVAVLDSLGLTFVFYVPRTIQLTLISSNLDLWVWVGSVVFLSVLVISSHFRGKQRVGLFDFAIAVLSITVSFLLIFSFNINPMQQIIVYALFALGTIMVGWLVLTRRSVLGHSAATLFARSLIYLLITFAAIEISSAVHFVTESFNPPTQIGQLDAGLEMQFSYIPYAVIPWLYVAFLFSWAWIPLVRRLTPKQAVNASNLKTAVELKQVPPAQSDPWFSSLLDPRFLLALAAGFFVGFYPYFQNPPWLVGTDAKYHYLEPLTRMASRGVEGGFVQSLVEWHPAALSLMYLVQLVFHSTPFYLVRFTPLFLIVALALSSWWFIAAKEDIGFGLLVFILSVLSVTTTVGFYSSILANWMALLLWTLFFAYVCFRAERGFRIVDAAALLTVSTMILFIHPWSWGVFAVTVLLASILALIQERREGLRLTIGLVSVVLIDLAAGLLSLLLLPQMEGKGVADALSYYTYVLRNPSSVLVFWSALTRLTQIWAPFFSPLILAVSILGVFYLTQSELTPWRRRLIFAWLFVSCIGSILIAPVGFNPANPTGSESQLWRLLFLTPLWLTAPVGVVGLKTTISRVFGNNLQNSNRGQLQFVWIPAVFGVGVVLALVPEFWHPFLTFILLPVAIGIFMVRSRTQERQLLGDIVLILFILVAFNNVTRSLSQLLLSPHNCDHC